MEVQANLKPAVSGAKIEAWHKTGWYKHGNLPLAIASLLVFLFFVGYLILCLTDTIPFSFDLDARPQADGTWQISYTPNQVGGISVGDFIVQVDGHLPTSVEQINKAHSLLVVHAESQIPYVVTLNDARNDPDAGLISQLCYCLVALTFYVIGLLIYLQARLRQPAAVFFVCCFGLAITLLCSAISYDGQIGIRPLVLLMAMVSIVAIFHFFLIFPKIKWSLRLPILGRFVTERRLIYVAYFSVGVNGLLLLFVPFETAELAIYLNLTLFLTGAVVVAIIKVFQNKEAQARGELRLLAVAISLAFGPFLVLQVLPNFLYDIEIINSTILISLFALLPIGFAYSIVQYQSLGITNLVRRNLVYVILAISLFSLYILLLYMLNKLTGGISIQNQSWLAVLFSVVAIFVFSPLQQRLQRLVDRFIFKDFYDYKVTLQEMTAALVQQVRLEDVGTFALTQFTKVLNSEFAALVIYQSGPTRANPVYYRKILKHSQSDARDVPARLEALADTRLPAQSQFYQLYLPQYEQPMAALEVRLDEDTSTVLTLGSKRSGEDFTAMDVSLVETIAGLLQVKLQNALLIDELERKVHELEVSSEQLRVSKDQLQIANEQVVRVGEEERTRLAHELHDEPLQRLMLVLRQFDCGDENITQREIFCLDLVREVSNTLRTICFQLRPSILDDLGLMAALESLVVKTRKETDLCISLQIDLMLEERRFSPEMEAVLYRVAQEALQNVVKHAHAQRVVVELSERDEVITLRVSDDGHGFVVPIDVNSLLQEGHLGLVGAKERFHSIGGKFEISSRVGEGTVVEAQIEI